MFRKHKIAAAAMIAGCAAASAASAATASWPTSVVGTWKGVSNQTPVVVTITSQTAGSKCQVIAGTMANTGSAAIAIDGYYCPSSGAIEFLRLPTDSAVAFQVYNGSLNQANAGAPHIFMAGSFGQYNPAYGPLGQYSFSLTKSK